jgi:hypothetical protein
MPTLNDLVDSVLAEVYSETATVDTSSYLTAGIDADDLAITVANGENFSRGVIEIGEELILVDSVNREAGILVVPPQGRGIRGTTPAAHSIGDQVTYSPSVSRSRAVRSVQEALRADSGGLYGVAVEDLTFSAAQSSYTLPVACMQVLNVAWDPGTLLTTEWLPVRRWTHDKHHGQLVLGDSIVPGRTVRVTYTTEVVVPAMTEEFSATGLPDSCMDVIRFSAAWRIVSFLEPRSLLAQAAEADAMGKNVAATRVRVAQYMYQMYRQRLAEEISGLQTRYPIRAHFGGTI